MTGYVNITSAIFVIAEQATIGLPFGFLINELSLYPFKTRPAIPLKKRGF